MSHRYIPKGETLCDVVYSFYINSLSFLVMEGYLTDSRRNRNIKITDCFSVDDLKPYAKNMPEIKKKRNSLDPVTILSSDIRWEYGQYNCFCMVLKRGKSLKQTNNVLA